MKNKASKKSSARRAKASKRRKSARAAAENQALAIPFVQEISKHNRQLSKFLTQAYFVGTNTATR